MTTRSSISGGKSLKRKDLLGFILDPMVAARRRNEESGLQHPCQCAEPCAHCNGAHEASALDEPED